MFWKGMRGYLPASIVQAVVGFLTIVIFTRLLTPHQFGEYALAFSVGLVGYTAVFMWMEAAMARFWAAQPPGPELASHFASLYRTAFAVTLAFLPLLALALWLAPITPTLKLAIGFCLGSAPVRSLVKLGQERLRAEGRASKSAAIDMTVNIATLVFGIGFVSVGMGGAAPVAGLAVASLAVLPFVLPDELRQARGGGFSSERLWRYARYGYPVAAAWGLTVVLSSTDRFLLAALMDEAAVGAYHAGYSIANRTLDVLFLWIGTAGQPALVMALEKGGAERLKIAAREQASIFILIGLPAAAGVALVAQPLADVLIGEELRATAVTVTPWIALSSLLWGVTTYYFGQAFTLGRRTGLLLATMLVPASANVVLNLILVPRFGVVGAAWATAISFALHMLVIRFVGRRVMPLPMAWDALIRCSTATAVMAGVVSLLPDWGGVGELMLKAIVGGVVYGVVVMTLNGAGVRDHALTTWRRLRSEKAAA